MRCDRCEGLMLEDNILDMDESFEGMWLHLANRHRHARLKWPDVRQEEVVLEALSGACTPLAA